MPVTAATNLIGALSIAGVPPLNGFWSKLIIIIALVQAGQWGFAVAAVLASVLTLWYYLLIQRKAFFGKLDERWKDVKEAPFWMLAVQRHPRPPLPRRRPLLRPDDQDLDPAGGGRPGPGSPDSARFLGNMNDGPTKSFCSSDWSSSRSWPSCSRTC